MTVRSRHLGTEDELRSRICAETKPPERALDSFPEQNHWITPAFVLKPFIASRLGALVCELNRCSETSKSAI